MASIERLRDGRLTASVAAVLPLDSVWRDHLAPQIQDQVSPAVFRAIAEAVDKAFAGTQTLWATFGGALALWQVSGAVRAVMGAFVGSTGRTRSDRS